MCYSVGAPTGEAFTEPNQRGPARKGRPSFFFCPSQPKAPSRRKRPGHPDLPRAAEIAPDAFPSASLSEAVGGKMYPPPNPRPFIGARRSGSGPLPQPLHVAHPRHRSAGGCGPPASTGPFIPFLGACATCRPLACRLAWAGEAPYHSPGQNARVKCTAPPLFLLGGAALAFCPCLLRQGAHPEGTGPLPWPVGPAGPRAGLARRQSDAAQLGPLYDGGAKLGRHFKRGRARQVAPAGLYLPWGASARPLGWRPGGACGHGGACGRGPHHQRQFPPVALLGAPL